MTFLPLLQQTDSDAEDAEDENEAFVAPLLPSQRSFSFCPCVPPTKKKIVPNLKSVDDFPSLGGEPASTATPKSETKTMASGTVHSEHSGPTNKPDYKRKSKSKKKSGKCQVVKKANNKHSVSAPPAEQSKVSTESLDSKWHQITKEWTVKGDNVIQIEGLPSTGDTSNLEDLISSFGTILKMEHRLLKDKRALRIR